VPVNKSELVDAVAGKAGVSKTDAEGVLDAFFETVRSSAKGGDKVAWPGFGSFSTSQRSARTGRNPRTGQPVKIAASTAMKFTASSALKDFLNSRGAAAKKAGAKKAAKSAKKAGKRR
jgi:DNA-binding protein HU-beta